MLKSVILAALLALAAPAFATPTRVREIDHYNLIVPDDYDGTYYYSLSPNFVNHWYVDYYSDGTSLGWAFLNVGVGDLVIWWNKAYEAGSLYTGLSGGAASLGLNGTAFAVDTLNAWEPREKRVAVPDNKLALGYALPVSDSLTLALCFRLAEANAQKDFDQSGPNGAPILLGASTAAYMASLYGGMQTSKYWNTQGSNALLLSPQFSWAGRSLAVDCKVDMIWNGIDNKHSEEVHDAGLTQVGTVTQTLKDHGTLSWQAKPRVRYMLNDSDSLVLRGTYGKLGLGADHHITGSFTGAGLTAAQQAGLDQTDSTSDLGLEVWDGFLGYLKTWDHGKDLLVMGAGANGTNTSLSLRSYQPRAGGVNFNDLTALNSTDSYGSLWAVPFIMGTELTLKPWLRGRASVSRNLFNGGSTATRSDSFAASGALASHSVTTTGSDAADAWWAGAGFGFYFGALTWDIALDNSFLASATGAAMANPLLQSSFTYDF